MMWPWQRTKPATCRATQGPFPTIDVGMQCPFPPLYEVFTTDSPDGDYLELCAWHSGIFVRRDVERRPIAGSDVKPTQPTTMKGAPMHTTGRQGNDSEASSSGSAGSSDGVDWLGRDGRVSGRRAEVPERQHSHLTPVGWALGLAGQVVRRGWRTDRPLVSPPPERHV